MSDRAWRVMCALLALGYVAACALTALIPHFAWTSDLEPHYWPAVQEVLDGHPTNIYSPRAGQSGLNHGPVILVPLSVLGYLLTVAGWMGSQVARRAAAEALFGLLCVLVSVEAVRAVIGARQEPLTRRMRLGLAAAFLAFPPLIESGVAYGHIEVPLSLWFCLRALRSLVSADQHGRSGVILGLALLTRDTALLVAVPMAFMLMRQRGFHAAGRLTIAAGATVLVGFGPFFLIDPAGVRSSLFTRGTRLNYGNGTLLGLTKGTPIEGLAHADVIVIGAAAVLGSAAVIRAAPRFRIGGPSMFVALMAIAASFPLLAKDSWAYYLVETAAFGFIASFGASGQERARAAGIPFTLVVVASLLQMYQHHVTSNADAIVTVGVVCAGLLVLAMGWAFVALKADNSIATCASDH